MQNKDDLQSCMNWCWEKEDCLSTLYNEENKNCSSCSKYKMKPLYDDKIMFQFAKRKKIS